MVGRWERLERHQFDCPQSTGPAVEQCLVGPGPNRSDYSVGPGLLGRKTGRRIENIRAAKTPGIAFSRHRGFKVSGGDRI